MKGISMAFKRRIKSTLLPMITASTIRCINCGIGSDTPDNGNGLIKIADLGLFDSYGHKLEARQRCRLLVKPLVMRPDQRNCHTSPPFLRRSVQDETFPLLEGSAFL